MTIIRGFEERDAAQVSALFYRVYGEDYFYPEIYLPSVICHHNRTQRWQSVVALQGDRIVGHASLWRSSADERCAELAMIVVDPQVRGQGIATRLGQDLCGRARQQHLAVLTIKMVASHVWTQRLGLALGFQATGLLLDYVESPFSHPARETAILGVLPLQAHPIPLCAMPGGQPAWIAPLIERFGAVAARATRDCGVPPKITVQDDRMDLIIECATYPSIIEASRLPSARMTHLWLKMDANLAMALSAFHQAGYVDTGLALGPERQWYWLLQRGFSGRQMQLHCPTARALLSGVTQEARHAEAS
ncbi:GNAT family N-acetyltransferase [Pseudomonas entomophila]|uniref:GNAT family N-acetyltransferase n=1 Tax=Pseudomonas entomophila TaxID=312306 RepID=UPI0024053CD6|nr:GNAT family N-acetyltransferase [Pseudomonas entomophila]MDF9619019.1 GNAT family N-acetyltransferase [Pseudomonas entomophila]